MMGMARRTATRRCLIPAWAVVLAAAATIWVVPAAAAPLEDLADSVQEFTLDNGLRFLVVEQHDAPVFSYALCVDAGGVCNQIGTTGIAHMFEHMAFKGTPSVGTENYKAERKAMVKTDEAWDAVLEERAKRFDADSTRIEELMAVFKEAVETEAQYIINNEFSRVLEENGGRYMNAFTGADMTCFFYSLPSNRLELWARMEGDRLSTPVLREFYKEREVVHNERRLTSESTPIGRLFEDVQTTAFSAHPYKNTIIGHASDIANYHRRDARAFYKKYYVATNMTVCVVGDVTVDQVRRMAKKYFSGINAGPDPGPVMTTEPAHRAERRVIIEEESNPVVMIGWQSPASADPDYATMEFLMEILGSGRSSRLHKRLVKEEQVATQVGTGVGLPGDKYPNLAGAFVFCAAERDPFEAEALIYAEVDRMINAGPTLEELKKVKTGYLARTMRELRQPRRLALGLAMADQMQGHWRRMFEHLERIEAVTAEKIQRLAAERLIKERRTVGMLIKPTEPPSESADER